MERNREGRRGSMAAISGGGLSRRRQRSSGLRDSPDDDGAMEMPDTSRLRERPTKRDRDRDRSSRSKRRRADRMMHGGGREDGEESSEESLDDDDEDEEEDQSISHRSMAQPPATSPAPLSSSASQNAHPRRNFPPGPSPALKSLRPPLPGWKVADEVICASVPRKARSASAKRPLDYWASGACGSSAGGGAGAEHVHRQASTSPARPSSASTPQVCPPSSTSAVRKKLKPVSGPIQRPIKNSKPPAPAPAPTLAPQEDIEFEVAEVLFGMTRQFQAPNRQENNRVDSKDSNGSVAASPISQPAENPQLPFSNQGTTAPKRKRPRPLKLEEEIPKNPLGSLPLPVAPLPSSSPAKLEGEEQKLVKLENAQHSSPTSKISGGSMENGRCHPDLVSPPPVVMVVGSDDKSQDNHESESGGLKVVIGLPETDDHVITASNETLLIEEPAPSDQPDHNLDEIKVPNVNSDLGDDAPDQEEKFSIDLMAPPPGKSSPERDDNVQVDLPVNPDIGLVSKMDDATRVDNEIAKESPEISSGSKKEKDAEEEASLKKLNEKERPLDLELELEKPEKEIVGTSNKEVIQKQQFQVIQKPAKMEVQQERAVPHSVSMPMQVPSGWPTNIPPFGYMGQFPQPMQPGLPTNPNSGASRQAGPISFLPPQPFKRCMTHCGIAQTIHYHQQLAKMSHLLPSTAGPVQLYGARQYNLNGLPPSESAAVGNSIQGNLPRTGSSQEKGSSSGVVGCTGHSIPEKSLAANNSHSEISQRKQVMLQPAGQQPGSTNNMLHGPHFIFLGGPATAGRPGAQKSTAAVGNAAPSPISPASSGAGTAPPTMNFNYAGLSPNDAQYLAMLQNSAYPFSNPAHVGASSYRAASLAQAMPFYGGSFYPSPIIHSSQFPQMPQLPAQNQQGHQNTSTSSGSSSSQKHTQQSQQVLGGGICAAAVGSHSFPTSKQGQHTADPSTEDRPVAVDSRGLQAQKGLSGHNLAMPVHPQNFSLISPVQAAAVAAAALGSSGGRNEKQTAVQHQSVKVELAPSQAFAMSFSGVGPSAAGSSPGGLEFSAGPHSHAFYQSMPDSARHGYHAVQMAAASQAAHQVKKLHTHDDVKSLGDSMNTSIVIEEDRKVKTSSKVAAGGSQSLMFSRSDEAPGSSILSNSATENSSRTLNLIPAANASARVPHRSSNSFPTTSSATAAVGSSNSQQQQQLVQFQKQQQHQLQLQHQFASRTKSVPPNNASLYTERLPGSSTMSKFPQTLSSFPQALIQGSGGSSPSPQWKGTSRSGVATHVPSPSATSSSSSKGQHLPQQQSRVPQQSSNSAHQTQISFGVNPMKMASSMGQSNLPSLSPVTPNLVGSFPNSVSKSAGGGSPQGSLSGKSSSHAPTTLPHSQQSIDKVSQSGSILKPSSGNNRSMASVISHHHITPTPTSSSSSKQQHPLQTQHKSPYPAAQLFFSSSYMPGQPAQSNASSGAASTAYFQRHQSELISQQSQQNAPASMGLLSLCSSGLTLSAAQATNDPAKAMVAAANLKGMQAPGLLQHSSQPSTAAPYSLISAAGAGFPYIHAMPPVSVKPSEQKSSAGNDSVSIARQPDKR